MHEETYPAFFTPRDKEPSLSSFEEKSSEFDWLERKLTRKQKYEEEIEQVLCSLGSYIWYIYYIYDQSMIDTWSITSVKEITNYI